MERQLKQRLVGVAVLVSLAVLVVPILFDGGYRRAPVPRRDIAPMPADSFEDSVPPLAQSVQDALEAGLDADPEALSEAAAEDATLDLPPAVDPPAFVAGAGGAAADPAAAVAAAPPAAQQPDPTPPSPTPKPAPPVSAPDLERWTVQLGSFASRANAEGLLARVKNTGVDGFILPLTEGGKTTFRVRAGPVAGRAAADRLRQDLERTQSIRGMLVRYP